MRHFIAVKAILLIAVMVLVGSLTARTVLAGTGQIYASPGSIALVNGSNVTVAIRINPGAAVSAVQFTLGWDSSKLKYISLDGSQSAFSTNLAQSVSASSLSSARGIDLGGNPLSGDSLILNVTFQALAGTGSTALTLSAANASAPDGSYTNPSVGNSTVNFSTPATTPAPTPTTPGAATPKPLTPTPSTPSTPSTPANPSPSTPSTTTPTTPSTSTTDTTPPEVNDVDIDKDKVKFTSASVSLKTSEPTQVYIKYGVGDQLNLQTALSTLSNTHDIDLTSAGLVPGNTYSYQVIATDAGGNVTSSVVKTFKTKGFTLRVTVLDKENKPLKKSKITLHSEPQEVKTDSKGIAEFTDVAPGNHKVIYTDGGKEYSQPVNVDNNIVTDATTGAQSAALQNVAVILPVTAGGSFPVFLPISVLLLAVVGAAIYLFRDKFGTANRWQAQAVPSGSTGQFTMNPPVNPTVTPYAPPSATQVAPRPRPNNVPAPGSVVAPRDDHNDQGREV